MVYKLSSVEHDILIFLPFKKSNSSTTEDVKSVYKIELYWSDNPTDKISATPIEG